MPNTSSQNMSPLLRDAQCYKWWFLLLKHFWSSWKGSLTLRRTIPKGGCAKCGLSGIDPKKLFSITKERAGTMVGMLWERYWEEVEGLLFYLNNLFVLLEQVEKEKEAAPGHSWAWGLLQRAQGLGSEVRRSVTRREGMVLGGPGNPWLLLQSPVHNEGLCRAMVVGWAFICPGSVSHGGTCQRLSAGKCFQHNLVWDNIKLECQVPCCPRDRLEGLRVIIPILASVSQPDEHHELSSHGELAGSPPATPRRYLFFGV